MRREAKNANTITMRIGKAALLKKRLMMRSRARGAGQGRIAEVDAVSCGDGLLPQRRDVRQVAVALGMVQPVSDREAVRDLEADVLGGQVHLPPRGLGQQRADLQ